MVSWDVQPGNSIQNAVNNAQSGDVIIVHDDNGNIAIYNENIKLSKKIILIAAGNVKIKTPDENNPCLSILAGGEGSIVEGFKLTGAKHSMCITIYNADNCIILKNEFDESNYAVSITNSDNNLIYKNNYANIFNPNKETYGINLIDSQENEIRDNIISEYRYGIYLMNSDKNRIHHNHIKKGGHGIDIFQNSNENQVFENKLLKNLEHGIFLDFSGENQIHRNEIDDNSKTDVNGITIGDQCLNNQLYKNKISNNRFGIFTYRCGYNEIKENNIYSNADFGVWNTESSGIVANFNRIADNEDYSIKNGSGQINGDDNWLGSNQDPNNSEINLNYATWLVLRLITDHPADVHTSNTDTIQADISLQNRNLIFDLTANSASEILSPSKIPDGIKAELKIYPPNSTEPIIKKLYTQDGKIKLRLSTIPNIIAGSKYEFKLDQQVVKGNIIA